MRPPPRVQLLAVISALALACGVAAGQGVEYRLDTTGRWSPVSAADENADRSVMTRTRELIASRKFTEARELIHAWLNANSGSGSPYVAEAYVLRGDSKVGQGDEFDALYDYERVVNRFPGSEMFATALERELDVASLYFGGLRRRSIGWIRIDSGRPIAEEIVMRINERLPGSKLAERALLELGNFYYKRRDLRMASETYDVFLTLFPTSRHRVFATQRRIFSNVAQFKGPRYDATPLIEARLQIDQFAATGSEAAEQLGLGDELKLRLDEAAAEQMLSVANWYITRGDPTSARFTMQRLVRRYPSSKAAEQAFDELTKRGWIQAG
ncbi:MAG: outer membrane protein assembly factor BamD, partial [Phycisphaerales bacterium]